MKLMTSPFRVSVLFVLACSLHAQTNTPDHQKIAAKIPFDFMVEQVMFPAGSYTITQTGSRAFHLQAEHGKAATNLAAQTVSAPHPETPRLIFSDENGHYRLSQLWMNAGTGGEISPRGTHLSVVRGSHLEVPATCINCN
jgi:hypothetical protein